MIINALANYYDTLHQQGTLPPYGFSEEKISYAITLSADGEVVAIQDLHYMEGKKKLPKTLPVPQPEKRTSGIKPNFMWDKTAYVLGVKADKSKKELVRIGADAEFQSFQSFHDSRLSNCKGGVTALAKFLKNWTPDQFEKSNFTNEMLDANCVFRLDGEHRYLHEYAEVAEIWADILSEAKGELAHCLVSGKPEPIARLHPAIKGVNGAQSAGASIVSFNGDAFTSYGKPTNDGLNSPVSQQSAFAYTSALNYLLRRSEHNRQRLSLGDATVVFWAETKGGDAKVQEDFMAMLLSGPTAEQEADKLRTVLENVASGRALSSLDPELDETTRFYILGLAPNAARLSIRFWMQDTLEELSKRFAQHYQDLYLEPAPWKTIPTIWRLLYTVAVLGKAENIPPQLAGEFSRSILSGQRYPQSLLSNLIMRIRSEAPAKEDREVSEKATTFGLRVALIKAILTRDNRLGNKPNEGEIPVSLDKENKEPAYLLGRLFSELENAQQAALGRGVNATIRDRYYGSASATPASVFALLLKNTNNHLAKLRKNDSTMGVAIAIDKKIQEILGSLSTEFPKNMSLSQQGKFAIGYYHQSQERFQTSKANESNTAQGE